MLPTGQVDQLFAELDADASGSVSLTELRECFTGLGCHFKSEDWLQLLSTVDKDHSGCLDRVTLARLLYISRRL
jgi:Ca2+-binding EF-hand superfamily protein